MQLKYSNKANKLLQYLPKIKGLHERLVERQTTNDIIKIMMASAIKFQPQYDLIPYNEFSNLQDLWNFTKNTFTYKEDSELAQDIKSPAVMLTDAINGTNTIDCKGYSMFMAGILQNWVNYGKNIDWFFKFVGYDSGDPTHVYIVADNYILDCCENKFDKESIYFNYICVNPFTKDMAINRISGKNNVNRNPTPFGRQAQIGEGSGGGGGKGGGGGGGSSQSGGGKGSGGTKPNKPPKEDKPKDGKPKEFNPKGFDEGTDIGLLAPSIKVFQPTSLTSKGSITINPSSETLLLFALSTLVTIADMKGKIVQSEKLTPTDTIGGKVFSNLNSGDYVVFFSTTIKKKKLNSKGTKFTINKFGTSNQGGGTNKGGGTNQREDSNQGDKEKSLLTPTNLAIGAGVIIGGYLLLNKKK